MSKKLDQKQQRRLAEERKRQQERSAAVRRNFFTIGVAVLVAGIVVVAIFLQRQSEGERAQVGVPLAQADCDDVEETESAGRDHIEEGAPHEPYSTDPPTSGPHYEVPANAGFYSEPIAVEQLIHNLEHGQIVIYYSPELSETEVQQLQEIVDQEPIATLAVPYSNVESGYVMTAWTASQTCEEVSSAAVDEFRRQFQGKSPEPLTPEFSG